MSQLQLNFDVKKDLLHIFATPLARFSLDEAQKYTPRIAEAILTREAAEPGIERSNKGGWHSDQKMLQWPELKFIDLESLFRESVYNMIALTSRHKKFKSDISISAWANVNRAGSFNSSHVHPENHWSGVFYVKTTNFDEDPVKRAGKLEFHDPRGAIRMLNNPSNQPDKVGINPIEGNIMLFPSWLYHSVNTFTIDTVRISIAFNARIEHFEPVES